MALAEPQTKTRVSYDQFERFLAERENADRHFELIDGEIVEKNMPTEEHGQVTGNIFGPLWVFNQQHKLGRVVVEVLYRHPDDPNNARQPDISFTLNSSDPVVTKGAVPRMPDLAVEIKSPTDSYKDMREKAYYYLAHGSKRVWLVYPEKRQVEVIVNDDFQLLSESDTLDGGDLLPGFALPVSAIFPVVEKGQDA
jgi:Uma2 family endonuclease